MLLFTRFSPFCLATSSQRRLTEWKKWISTTVVVRFIRWKSLHMYQRPRWSIHARHCLPPSANLELANFNTPITPSEPRCPEPSYSDFAADRSCSKAQ
jgi:hypothetical protein